MDIVISFDDTGSMSSVRRIVRQEITALVDSLFSITANPRIGIIIHNDYCDRDTLQLLDLTSDKEKIKLFVNRDSSCGGGDMDECYELVLHSLHKSFSWESTDRLAIVIGDCNPHPVGYKCGTFTNLLDWRKEALACKDIGLPIYSIQALGRGASNSFYTAIANLTGGKRLELNQFKDILTYIQGILHSQSGTLSEFIDSVPEHTTNNTLKKMFATLLGKTLLETATAECVDEISTLSKFQVMKVKNKTKIQDFVTGFGLRFKAGKGYYQLVKTETVQKRKEILMRNKVTSEVITDRTQVRLLLGLPEDTEADLNPRKLSLLTEWDVFIQSTSYTRILDANTEFLYELDYA